MKGCARAKNLSSTFVGKCHNPSFGLATKAKGTGQEEAGSHITYSRECKECEGMNLHIPK